MTSQLGSDTGQVEVSGRLVLPLAKMMFETVTVFGGVTTVGTSVRIGERLISSNHISSNAHFIEFDVVSVYLDKYSLKNYFL